MVKKLYFSFLLLLCADLSFGQVFPLPGTQGSFTAVRIVELKQPLVIIGTLETNYSSLLIDSKNLNIIKVYRDSLELASFGEKGNAGVILADLKNKVPLLRLDEVLDYYKIPATHRTLKVMVNKALVDPKLFLADVQQIQKIEKIKQDVTASFRYSFDKDEEYLNIVTVKN